MNRKTVVALFGIFLGTSLLAGCASTPEESLVKQKGEASLKNYEEAETLASQEDGASVESSSGMADEETDDNDNVVNVLQQSLGAPEHYQSEVSDETGKLQVLTDADLEIPDADRVSAIAVSQHPFDQTVIDRITDTFFPEAKIYLSSDYNKMTQADCREKIEQLKGYVAEGNLDPYNLGTDENGNYFYDIYADIEQYEQMYQSAPQERNLVEVRPQYGLTEDDGQGETYSYDNQFIGVACQPDGTVFNYIIKSYGAMDMEMRFEKIREAAALNSNIQWIGYDSLQSSDAEKCPDEEDMPREIGISMEEAKQIADEKVAGLQLENMEMTSWEYGICREVMPGKEEQSLLDFGYMFHYTRKLNGIPITYTTEWGGNLEDMDSEMETWAYEVLDVIVTGDGIDTVNYNNPYDIGEIRTENLSLLPFDKIMEIYEKMMLIQNADVLTYAVSETYHIDRIVFGYSRIYEPSTDSRTGLLVPVWDFFGGDDIQLETERYSYASKYSSYMTINAIDGSIINRGLGY